MGFKSFFGEIQLGNFFIQLTLEITRLRASKATFDAKMTPLAQPTSKNGR